MQFRFVSCLLLFVLWGCEQKHALTPSPSPATGGGEIIADPDSLSRLRERESQAPARRIVSLTPGLTELIYAVGAEASLLATVEYSDYPAAAKNIPRIGDAFHVDMERLLALQPDLVLVWTTGTPVTTVEQIKALGLRVESIEVQHLSEVSASLLRVGALTGTQARAQQAAQEFEQGVAALRAKYVGSTTLRTFVEVNQQPLYTVNGRHVISEVLGLCGGENVFADLNQLAPAIGVEAVLKTNPDVILSTEGTDAQIRQDWRAWPQLEAVKQAHIYAVSPDTTTRATPRLLQGARDICEALQRARVR
jgi:iron complex transport system substrate-binding protein